MNINLYSVYECTGLEEVKTATTNLEKAKMVTLFANDGGVMKEVIRLFGINMF